MKQILKHSFLGLMALLATAACDSKSASLGTMQTASIDWDQVAASEQVASAPRNYSLIFMR